MIIEKKPIEGYSTDSGILGHITLEKLAKPETITVSYLDNEVIPCSFDCFGHPNFTLEQERLFAFKDEDFRRKNGMDNRLKAVISYEEDTFDVPRTYFDSIQGIQDSLIDLELLNAMLVYRKVYRKIYETHLNEFMIFGCFKLDCFGQIWSIDRYSKTKLISNADIESFETFRRNNESFSLTFGGFAIPKENSICPCCGKSFTIQDVKSRSCIAVEGKYYHDNCYSEYRKLREIDKLTRNMMSLVYKPEDYTFELLPNGYCSQDCCSSIPWLLFHTPDGDIKMGWRKRVISIEWQENYKAFSLSELFGKEDVTKWDENGKRGIHAWGDDKCYEYLEKVFKVVRPKTVNRKRG